MNSYAIAAEMDHDDFLLRFKRATFRSYRAKKANPRVQPRVSYLDGLQAMLPRARRSSEVKRTVVAELKQYFNVLLETNVSPSSDPCGFKRREELLSRVIGMSEMLTSDASRSSQFADGRKDMSWMDHSN